MPQKPKMIAPAILLSVALAAAGCSRTGDEAAVSGAGTASTASAGPTMASGGAQRADPPKLVDPDVEEWHRYGEEMRRLLMTDSFDALDGTRDRLWKDRLRDKLGRWKLRNFYDGLFLTGKDFDEEGQVALIGKLQSWAERKPQSAAARTALGLACVNWAEMGRGPGFANEVSEEHWRLYRERLKQAADALESARDLPSRDIDWYLATLRVARGQGWDRKAYDAVFDEAFAREPLYYYLCQEKAMYLMPHWYGSPGETAQFMKEVSDRVGGADGDALYYKVGYYIATHVGNDNAFKEYGLDWRRMHHGFLIYDTANGTPDAMLNSIARLAVLAGERQDARALFERIGSHWDPGWWSRSYFLRCRAWALGT